MSACGDVGCLSAREGGYVMGWGGGLVSGVGLVDRQSKLCNG